MSAPEVWLGALSGLCQHQRAHWTVGQFCAFHYRPVSQGKPGPKTEGSYSASPCGHSSQLIQLLSFQRDFIQTPREPPTVPQGRCISQRRLTLLPSGACFLSLLHTLGSWEGFSTQLPQWGREANRDQSPKTKHLWAIPSKPASDGRIRSAKSFFFLSNSTHSTPCQRFLPWFLLFPAVYCSGVGLVCIFLRSRGTS